MLTPHWAAQDGTPTLQAETGRRRNGTPLALEAVRPTPLTPELAICGYAAEDLYLRPAFIQACDEAVDQVVDAIVTEKGVVLQPDATKMQALFGG